MGKKILVSGSVAYDVLLSYDGSFLDGIPTDSLENLSAAFVTSHYARHHGGTGANIAWNVRLLGADPLLVSTVGSDGGPYVALLQERGVDTSRLDQIQDAVTATAIIATDDSERQITFFHPGADAKGEWNDLNDDRDDIGYAIVAPRDVMIMQRALQWCHAAKLPVLFDPGQQLGAFGDDALQRAIEHCTGVIANEYEWSLLAERLTTSEEDLLNSVDLLCITKGEKGASLFTKNGTVDISPCKPDNVVNPTGAGDAFRAGLLTGLSSGWTVEQAGQMGASLASFVVEIEGTLPDMLDREEVWERARRAYGVELPVL